MNKHFLQFSACNSFWWPERAKINCDTMNKILSRFTKFISFLQPKAIRSFLFTVKNVKCCYHLIDRCRVHQVQKFNLYFLLFWPLLLFFILSFFLSIDGRHFLSRYLIITWSSLEEDESSYRPKWQDFVFKNWKIMETLVKYV